MNSLAKFTHDQFQQNWQHEPLPSEETKPEETQNAAASQASINPAIIAPPGADATGPENRVT